MSEVQRLVVPRNRAQNLRRQNGFFAQRGNVWQELESPDKEVRPRWSLSFTLPLDQAFAKGENDEKVDVPETGILCSVSGRLGVEVLHVDHELVHFEEMKHLAAVKFDGVDQKDGIVDTWYEAAVESLRASRAVPSEVIGAAVEQQTIGRKRRLADMVVGDAENMP